MRCARGFVTCGSMCMAATRSRIVQALESKASSERSTLHALGTGLAPLCCRSLVGRRQLSTGRDEASSIANASSGHDAVRWPAVLAHSRNQQRVPEVTSANCNHVSVVKIVLSDFRRPDEHFIDNYEQHALQSVQVVRGRSGGSPVSGQRRSGGRKRVSRICRSRPKLRPILANKSGEGRPQGLGGGCQRYMSGAHAER